MCRLEGQLKRNIIWNTLGNLIYLASQWLVTVLVTRLFGYDDAGILSLAMSVSAAFQTIAMFGIRNYQVSDINSKYPDSCYTALRGITCIAALTACLIFNVLNLYDIRRSLSIMMFMLFRLSEDYSDVLHGIAHKNGRLDIVGKGFALKGILLFGAFLAGYYLGLELNVCLLLMAAAVWSVTLLFDFPLAKKVKSFKLTYNFKECINLGKNTVPLFVYLFLSSSMAVIPKYILEKMSDETTLGAYSSIFAPAVVLQASATYIYAPFVGTFARLYLQKKFKDMRRLATRIMLVLTAVFSVCIAVAAVWGEWGLKLIFGESILPFIYLLLPVIAATFFVSVTSFLYMIQIVIRDFKNLIIGCSAGFICCCVSAPLMIRAFGTNGTSASMITAFFINILYISVTLFARLKKKE